MNDGNESSAMTDRLTRKLGLFDGTMMMIGIVLGSGIFLTTGIIAEALPSPGLMLLAWLGGGLLTLCGALIYAELGTMLPVAGGQYVYLREAYGKLSAFLFGWLTFFVYLGGAIAGLGVAFSEYFGNFFPALSTSVTLFSTVITVLNYDFPISLSAGQLVAVIVIVLISAINYVGVELGKYVQNTFTVIKIATILLFVGFGLSLSKPGTFELSLNPDEFDLGQLITGFGVALVAISWTFDGWNNINFVAGEIRQPGRNLPLVLIFGTVGVTVLYLMVNIVYLSALSISEMAGVITIAESASAILFGNTGKTLLSVAVLISIFGALNGSIFVGPRIYYAMAKDKLFFEKVAYIHPRFQTPSFAIVIQAAWASVLVLTGTFEQLLTYVIFVAIIFWIAAAASVFTLRRKYPHLQRPYKVWGYPVVPIIFIAVSAGILMNTLIESPAQSIAGLAFILLGIPVFYFWRRCQT